MNPHSIPMRLCIAVGLIVSTAPLLAADFTPAARKFLDHNCAECHNKDVQKGGLRVDQLSLAKSDRDQFNRLVHLFDRVQSGEMPPKKADQPSLSARSEFINELRVSLINTERLVASDVSGRSSVRRMNRTEYESSLRDLLALPLLRVKEMLPEDGQQFGFDKVGGGLDISHIQLAKYLQTADIAVNQANAKVAAPPPWKVWRESATMQNTALGAVVQKCGVPINRRGIAPGLDMYVAGNPETDYGNSFRAASFKGDAESFVVLTSVLGHHQPEGIQIDRFNPPVGGWYRVRFSIWSLHWNRDKVEPAKRGMVKIYRSLGKPYFKDERGRWQATPLPEAQLARSWMENIEFYGEGEATHVVRASLKGQPIGYFDAPSMKPTTHEIKIWLNPGERISFHAMTLPANPVVTGSVEGRGVLDYEGPGIAYDWFEVEGPLIDQWPPESKRRMFGEPTKERADHRKLLCDFATRAFRHPVHEAELTSVIAIVDEQIKRGVSWEQAMLAGCKAILCAPDFLIIGLESGVPKPSAKVPVRLGDHALASRLSFFLWNSVPDAELLELAGKGELSQPKTLRSQVERMMADARSERFVEHFLDEWLELKKIDFTTPDPNLYPEYDPWLHDSMLAETRATFQRMLTGNLGARELIASDTVVINQRLAELYGIHDVIGANLREIKVPPGNPRGGFLTQAAVLKVTANGTVTSPTLRGVWIAERLLGIPRQPPPPNIPAIEPDSTGAVTIRQIIEKHRADASCASCHAKMDPLGLVLESFDVIGGWRDHYRLSGQPKKVRQGKMMVDEPTIEVINSAAIRPRAKLRTGGEVDASGELADGRKFADISELRTLLLADEDALARNLVRQLLIYSTGAGIRFADREAIEAIIARTKSSHHGLRSIIQEVVASELFQIK